MSILITIALGFSYIGWMLYKICKEIYKLFQLNLFFHVQIDERFYLGKCFYAVVKFG